MLLSVGRILIMRLIAVTVTEGSSWFVHGATLGLGWNRGFAKKIGKPLWEAWKQPYFGMYLRPARVSGDEDSTTADNSTTTEDVGSISFGAIDPQYTESDPLWLEVDATADLWDVVLDGVKMNGREINMTLSYQEDGKTPASLVPGKTTLGFPGPIVDTLMSAVEGATKWSISYPKGEGNDQRRPETATWSMPCDAKAELVLNFYHTEFTLHAADFTKEDPPGSGNCTVLIESDGHGDNTVGADGKAFLGLSFLRTVYSIWDPSVPRVGLANLKQQNQEPLFKEAPTQSSDPNVATSSIVSATTTGPGGLHVSSQDGSSASATTPGALLALAAFAAAMM